MPRTRIELFVRPSCHLCDQALAVIEPVAAEFDAEVITTNIDTDPALRRRYTDQVPVTVINGAPHDFWRVDPQRLRTALQVARR